MSKLPSFQFYPGDWLKDPALRLCSPQARALWIDMLCLMWETESRGILRTNGIIWTEKDVEKTTGIDRKFLQELVQKGVCAKASRSGVFYSKRLVRDELKRSRLARNGQKGGKSGKQNPSKTEAKTEAKPKQNPKQNGGSSSSSSFSSSPSVEKPKTEDLSAVGGGESPGGGEMPPDEAATQPPPPPRYTDLDMERAERLRAKIDQIDPRYFAGKRKPNLPSWADVFRLIRTVDGRTDEEIEIILTRLHEAPFWKGQVRSAEALRGTTSNGQYRFDAVLRDITSPRTIARTNARTNGFTDSNPEHTAALERAFG